MKEVNFKTGGKYADKVFSLDPHRNAAFRVRKVCLTLGRNGMSITI